MWGERVFLNVAEGHDLSLWCVDRSKGAVLWKRKLGGGNTMMRKQNMSSPSPVTDGTAFFVLGVIGTWLFAAVDAARTAQLIRSGLAPDAESDAIARRLYGNPLAWAVTMISLGGVIGAGLFVGSSAVIKTRARGHSHDMRAYEVTQHGLVVDYQHGVINIPRRRGAIRQPVWSPHCMLCKGRNTQSNSTGPHQLGGGTCQEVG